MRVRSFFSLILVCLTLVGVGCVPSSAPASRPAPLPLIEPSVDISTSATSETAGASVEATSELDELAAAEVGPDIRWGWAFAPSATQLRGEPDPSAPLLKVLPSGTYLKILETEEDWARVVSADETLQYGTSVGWVELSTLAPATRGPKWTRNFVTAELFPESNSTEAVVNVARWSWLQLLGDARNGRLPVRTEPSSTNAHGALGWIDAEALTPAPPPPSLPADLRRVPLPYYSQLDGTPWEDANCGPTAVSMALAALGIPASPTTMRDTVLDAQEIWGDDVGTFIWALAAGAEQRGAHSLNLYNGEAFRKWTTADVRQQVLAGHPVIVQVRYRSLPGRAEKLYYGDHYIVIHGLVGDRFVYSDPIDSDGPGFDRVMSAAELERAMNASDRKFAYSGFALSL
jgi:hypothetical protein